MIKTLSLIFVASFLFAIGGQGGQEPANVTKQEKAKQESKQAKQESKQEKKADAAAKATVADAEESEIDLTGIKCIKNAKKNASLDHAAEYRDAKVFFCCDNCTAGFEKDPDTYSTKANHQLILTGQFVQTACPVSGGDVDDAITSDVGGVEVAFCCDKCKKKVDLAKDLAAKSKLVFADKSFERGFAKKPAEIKLDDVKCFLMPKRDVSKEHAVDYRDGKVFFCCKNCPKRFSKDKSKYAVQANQHLVQTEQYEQTKCPFSGEDVVDGHAVTVNGIEVGLCCKNCKKKVDAAADEDAKAKLLFDDAAFEKGFAKKK